jgi:RNA polymerase sigma-32 factor
MTRAARRNEACFQSSLAIRTPLLGRQEELELARRFHVSQDRRAGERLARAHLGHVVALAIKHRRYGVQLSELIAEGNCGLVDALRKFDPERGVRFASYAKHWIRAYILAYVIRSRVSVGGGSGLIRSQLFFKLRRERARMRTLLGEDAGTDEALAKRLNLSVERLRELLQRLDCRDVPLDGPADAVHPQRVTDALVSASDPEQEYFQQRRLDGLSVAVRAALTSLDSRERFIVEKRMLAAPDDELTLAQIAADMKVSSERVRQLEERAKQKLKKSVVARGREQLGEWLGQSVSPSAA